MPKYSQAEKKNRVDEAKKLYAAGTPLPTCAQYLNVALNTLRAWAKAHDFEAARKAHLMQRPQILSAVIENFQSILEGHQPRITADQAVKYASSFEKLSDKKKLAGYTFEAFEALTLEMLSMIGRSKKKQEKEEVLKAAKIARTAMDAVIDQMIKAAFDE